MKKKFACRVNFISPPVAKLLRIMRLTTFLLIVFAMSVSAGGFSQDAKVTLSLKRVHFTRFFKAIEKGTNYRFTFSNDIIPQGRQVSVDVKDKSVGQVLKEVLASTNLRYRFVENSGMIIISEKRDVDASKVEVIERVITGKVTNEKGEPLSGVTIQAKGSSKTAVSAIDGSFSITVEENVRVLIFSYVEMATQEVEIGSSTSLMVKLKSLDKTLGDVVVVGYGTQRKGNITGAISSVKMNELSAGASTNISSALQGRVPGVSIESNSGVPGASLSITIRGSSTLGNNSPLVVIDGVPFGSLDGLNPSDIQSIDILKDAAAASIYGARAAGGVILVTTKIGRKNMPPKIQFNAVYSSQSIPKRMAVLSGEQWTNLFNSNGGTLPPYNGISTNWQSQIFRTAPVYKANLDITGGSDHLVYSIAGSYLKQNGTIINSDFTAANFRIKSLYEKGRVRIGETFIYNKTSGRTYTQSSQDATHSTIITALVAPPTIPVTDTSNPKGGWGRRQAYMKNLSNPVAVLNSYQDYDNNSTVTLDAFAEVRLIDQLKYKINVGLSDFRGITNNYTHPYDDGSTVINNPILAQNTYYSNSWLVENTLSYDKKIGRHSISLLAGYTAQRDTSNGFNITGYLPALNLYSMTGATSWDKPGGTADIVKRQSIIGRLIYSYDNRYLLSATIRRDGSSKFDSANGGKYFYGVFPAVSAGWNISNENFFRNGGISTIVNTLKVRGSFGLLGNDQISSFSTMNLISTNLNMVTGGGMVIGNIPNGLASPLDLKWEQTKTEDIGLDASLLNNRLSVVFDWFNKTSSGILLGVPIPLSSGINGSPIVNAGEVTNKGVELGLNYSDKAGAFTYSVGWNMTALRNKMTAITIGSGNQEFGDLQRAKVGFPLGGFFLIKTAGIFRSQQEIDAYTGPNGQKIQPNAQPGDIKFVDYNHDGQIDNNDQQYCGSPIPTFETGLTGTLGWHNFDLNLLLQGAFGNKIYNATRIWTDKMTEYTNLSAGTLNAWTTVKPNAGFPRFTLADPNLNARANSDRWLEDGSYIRLRRFEIGYTLPESIAKQKLTVDRLRAYLSFENLFTISKYKGYNPDLGNGGNPLSRGNDYGIYPLQRTITLGVSLSF